MKEKVIEAVSNKLDKLNCYIEDVRLVEENNIKTLEIVLDSEDLLDINTVTMATRILNPIIDKLDLVEGSYVLDVYAEDKNVEDINE